MSQCCRKVASGRVAGAVRSLVNLRGLQFECARVLHESLIMPVLMHDSEIMIWKEEMYRIRAVQMDNLRGFLGISIMDIAPNARIRELCRMKKGLMKGVLQWFSYVERMERVYVVVCAGGPSVGRLQKRWIETKKKGLDVRQE